MRRAVNFFRSNWSEKHALIWVSNIMLWGHVALGVAVLVGGPHRFPFPTYQPLLMMVNGATWVWGAWILGAAALMTVPSKWPQIIGLWFGMVWHIMWCAAFAVAIVKYPTAGATAAVAYGTFAMIDAALLTARIVDRNEE